MKYIIFVLIAIFLVACSSDSNSELQPSLSQNEMLLKVGERNRLTVSGATDISAVINSPVVLLTVKDNNIYVEAIKAGEGTIRVTADGCRLQCFVTVVEDEQELPDKPDEPSDDYDFSQELKDTSSRFVSADLTLRYDNIGVLFAIENGNSILIKDLDNDDCVEFSFAGVAKVGRLEDAQLIVNNSIVGLKEASIEQLTSDGMWIKITTINQEYITLVVAR